MTVSLRARLSMPLSMRKTSPDFLLVRLVLSWEWATHLLLPEEKLHANTRAVQARHDIEVAYPGAPLAVWELFDMAANAVRLCPHFSVEMETGTGKTYVYLRTIFELSRRYGFQKFIIVVPSVAIREGVLKNIEITGEHFRALYNNLPLNPSSTTRRRSTACANLR